MCAVGSRKALELAVKWVYSADNTMQMPYKDNLQALIHEPSFRFTVDHNTWGKLPFIIKLMSIPIDDRITDRYYQKEAIRAVCEQTSQGFRKHLLVMATGTGKTRTASSLTDVLSRGKATYHLLHQADGKYSVRMSCRKSA